MKVIHRSVSFDNAISMCILHGRAIFREEWEKHGSGTFIHYNGESFVRVAKEGDSICGAFSVEAILANDWVVAELDKPKDPPKSYGFYEYATEVTLSGVYFARPIDWKSRGCWTWRFVQYSADNDRMRFVGESGFASKHYEAFVGLEFHGPIPLPGNAPCFHYDGSEQWDHADVELMSGDKYTDVRTRWNQYNMFEIKPQVEVTLAKAPSDITLAFGPGEIKRIKYDIPF